MAPPSAELFRDSYRFSYRNEVLQKIFAKYARNYNTTRII